MPLPLSPCPPSSPLCQAGVASGPQALGLLRAAGMPTLAPLSSLCLSLIALAAGAELHLPELRRLRRQASHLQLAILPAGRVRGACGRQAQAMPCSWYPALRLLRCTRNLQVACVTAGVAVFSWVLVYAWCVCCALLGAALAAHHAGGQPGAAPRPAKQRLLLQPRRAPPRCAPRPAAVWCCCPRTSRLSASWSTMTPPRCARWSPRWPSRAPRPLR